MRIEVYPDADTVASQAARIVAAAARAACAARGQFTLAVSGGQTPWQMLRALADDREMPWDRTHLFQVDERVAPAGHAERNLTNLMESLASLVPLAAEQIHAMPVERADLEAAAADYARTLAQIAGSPAVLDLVHLGLGADGHTASLVPGDLVLNIVDADVALTVEYQGRRRMTLTYSILNRSRRILWLATGAAKAAMLKRLLAADATIPAGRVARSQAMVLADLAAAGDIPAT